MNNVLIIFFLLSWVGSFFLDASKKEHQTLSFAQQSQFLEIKNCYEASVSSNGNDVYVCAWSYRTNSSGIILGSILHTNQTDNRIIFQISDSSTQTKDVHPSVCWMNDHIIFAVWERDGKDTKRIVGRLINDEGKALSPVFAISDTAITQSAFSPVVQRNSLHEVLVAWQDYRNGNADIYSQMFDSTGLARGANVRVNDDAVSALQGVPSISTNNFNRFIILWIDNRIENTWSYFYQLWKEKPIGSNVLLDSVQKKDMTMTGASVWCGSDRAYFVWKDYRSGNSNIYMKNIDAEKREMSSTSKINDDAGQKWQRLPVIACDEKKRTVVCWEDYRNTQNNQAGDIYAQIFTPSLKRSGRNVQVDDAKKKCSRINPQIAMNKRGNYLIVWHQVVENEFQIMGQWFAYPGKKHGKNFMISISR